MGNQGVIIIVVMAAALSSCVVLAGGLALYLSKNGGLDGLLGGDGGGDDVYNQPGDVVWLYSEEGYGGKMQGFKPGNYGVLKNSFQGRPPLTFGVRSMKVKSGYKAKIWHGKNFTAPAHKDDPNKNRHVDITTDMWDLKTLTNNLGWPNVTYANDVISMKVLQV